MSRQDDLKEIRALTIKLNTWRDEYYNLNRPSVSDSVYDKEFDRLMKLEEKTGFFFSGSPTKSVGYQVSSKLPKIKHSYPLLSLDKTKDKYVALKFANNHEALLMHKLDGLTICLVYENGELSLAATRGNGEEGSIITENAKTFMNLPLKIDYKGHLKITGEGIIHKDDFEYINSRIENEDDKYSTPRNLASGSVQQLDSGICAKRRVYFYAFNVVEGLEGLGTLSKRLEVIKELGFDVCKHFIFRPNEINLDMFENLVDDFVEDAQKNNIPIDGLVIMHNDIEYGQILGKTTHHYRNGLALKFKEEEEVSIIHDIEWQVGRTGKITPVAIFDKVMLDNTEVSKASLHNLSIMSELGIKRNATITVVKKNEIIPQIIKAENGDGLFDIPAVCPVCGQPTERVSDGGSISLYCNNKDCVAKNVRRIAYFASKECMNIDGISEKTVEKLVSEGLLSNILDIYKLKNHKEMIINFDGMGERSYDKLVSAIEKSRTVKLENFIAALGIQNIALSKAKIISRKFDGSWEQFIEALESGYDFTELESFGTEVNKCIYKFYNEEFVNSDMYKELVSLMDFAQPEKTNGSNVLEGKVFVITGSLNIFSNRKALQAKIEELGGKAADSVSKKTTYLINNDSESSSSKNKNAKKFGVPIITEEEFLTIINGQ